MQQPEPQLFLVREPDDEPGCTAFLRRLADSEGARIVAEVRPGARGLAWVAAAVMEGLGKDLDAAGSGRNAGRMWRRAADWLIGSRTTDLFVSRVQILQAAEWQLLIDLAAETGARLWFVVQQTHLRRTHQELIDQWPFKQLSWDEFDEYWADIAQAAPHEASAGDGEPDLQRFPKIPDADFTSFLATVNDILPPSKQKTVAEAFGRGRCAFDSESERVPWQTAVRRGVSSATNCDEAVSWIRGAQVSLFLNDQWLRLELSLFRQRWEAEAHVAHTPALARTLSRFPSPMWTALAGLRSATQAGPAELAQLVILDAADDGTAVMVDGVEHELPTSVTIALRAQLSSRARDGAGTHDALFLADGNSAGTAADRSPLTVRGVQRIMRQIGDEIGVELVGRKSSWKLEDDVEWARRRGLVLREL